MECPPDKHKIEIWLTCEMFQQLQDAADYVGYGNDMERYIKMLIMERC